MQDLGRVLRVIEAEGKEKKSPLTRRFICTEGCFAKTGELVNLPRIMELMKEFKYRLFLDESVAFGTIGGKTVTDPVPKIPLGTFDYYGLKPDEHVIIVASLSGALGACGGFTAGSRAMINHQILSNQAYCYSASLPALFACSVLEAITHNLGAPLRTSIVQFNRAYDEHARSLSLHSLVISGHEDSALRFIRNSNPNPRLEQERKQMSAIVEELKVEGYLLVEPIYAQEEKAVHIRPSIKIGIRANVDWVAFFNALVMVVASISATK
jgi:serine palmitoyltransferase